ncbi:MAG: hypothetical protein RLZZ630_1948 [Bacteroidota bacterium]|jgi:outer membrane protein assembly factor BamA
MLLRILSSSIIRTVTVLMVLGATGCSINRSIPENAHLLSKNTIKCDQPELKEKLSPILKQKPNKKLLGVFRFHLSVYELANKGKSTKFKKWLKDAVGEPPVLFDQRLKESSSEQLLLYMQNNGYFEAKVADTAIFRPKRAHVVYRIVSGQPYRIRNYTFRTTDSLIAQTLQEDLPKSLIIGGEVFSNSTLQKERERVSNLLKNKGFYQFSPVYISFRIDSSLQSHQLDVQLDISDISLFTRDTTQSADSNFASFHKQSFFKDILLELDFDPLTLQDSVLKDTVEYGGVLFTKRGKVRDTYLPSHLYPHVFVRPGAIYAQDDVQLTYRRLSDLGIFRFINIRVEPTGEVDSSGKVALRCLILLSPQARQSYQIEGEGTNNGGNFGIAGNLLYKNKNLFRGAESLNIRIKGGVEIQQNFSDTTYESTRQLAFFNAYEIGPEVSITFPRALWPFHMRNPRKISNPTTSVSAGFNTQNRPEYFRQLVNLSYYYSIRTTKYNRFYFYPAEINYLNVDLDPAFDKQLSELQDPTIRLGYSDQFISNGRISYLFNNQELNSRMNYCYFRVNLEFAGNSVYLATKLLRTEPEKDGAVYLFNVPFAHYVRPDFDLRYYMPAQKNNSLFVVRLASGIGFAYGNNKQLPFEKSYFAGGPNEMRAWRTRQLGPGSSTKDDYFERFGEFKITGNTEFRFDIVRKFKGALFADAGNIWLVRNSTGRDDGLFRWSSFIEQMALGAGAGIRFDLTFFIIRLDGAVRVIDPAKPAGDRWTLSNNKLGDITFNFGIGYPF